MSADRARRVFWTASALALVHVVDEALLRAPAGATVELRVHGAAVVLGLVGLGGVAYAFCRVGWRALGAGLLGGVVTAHGGAHAVQAREVGLAGTTTTGLAALASGVALLALAVWLLLARRPVDGWRGWAHYLAIAAVGVAVAIAVVLPAGVGTVQVNLPRVHPAPPPTTDFAPHALHTDDGLTLAAWYRPSTNGAAVVLVSSARGDHSATAAHARLLASRGYGVLVYDARGSGGSEGTPNGWGWTWVPDVTAAVDFVLAQPDVRRGVGLLGLSTGADVAIEVAARDDRVAVVVADGATAQGFADRPPGALAAVSLWPMYATARLLTGTGELPPLAEAIADVAPRPVLLVAAGSIPQEIPLNEGYARAGGDAVRLWALPDVTHTRALTERPTEYARQVLGVLEDALLRRP